MRRVERAPGFLGDQQQLPDHRLGVLDLLEAARSVRSEAQRVKRRFQDMGGVKVNPALLQQATVFSG